MKQLTGFKIDKYYALTVILMITKLVLHLTAGTNYELHRDEMLYFNMAGHYTCKGRCPQGGGVVIYRIPAILYRSSI